MPSAPDAYELRTVEKCDDELDVHRLPISKRLDPGTHVLAISLHNHRNFGDSSDLRIAGISLVDVSASENEGADSVVLQDEPTD
ncbi:MAG: hypothetical protein KDA60_04520 [Planctomycetales bacterium]|nr:hypothetical protein [Planctomycetales bacterium]